MAMSYTLPDKTIVEIGHFDAAGPNSAIHLNTTAAFIRYKTLDSQEFTDWKICQNRSAVKVRNILFDLNDVQDLEELYEIGEI